MRGEWKREQFEIHCRQIVIIFSTLFYYLGWYILLFYVVISTVNLELSQFSHKNSETY